MSELIKLEEYQLRLSGVDISIVKNENARVIKNKIKEMFGELLEETLGKMTTMGFLKKSSNCYFIMF